MSNTQQVIFDSAFVAKCIANDMTLYVNNVETAITEKTWFGKNDFIFNMSSANDRVYFENSEGVTSIYYECLLT